MVDVSDLRRNWRAVLLTTLLLLSAAALFVPPGTIGISQSQVSGPTNLQFGLQLDGGTRIRAPIVGMHVSDVPANGVNPDQVRASLDDVSGIEPNDYRVAVDQQTGTIDAELFVRSSNVSKARFAEALRSGGLDVQESDVQNGVTGETRSEVVSTIDDKISRSGFAGTSVSQTSTLDGQHFVVIEAPNKDPQEIRDIVTRRGAVQIVATYPTNDGYENTTVLNSRQLESAKVGVATTSQRDRSTFVPITLSDQETAQQFSSVIQDKGFTTRGISNCRWRTNPEDPGYCLLTVVDGEVVYGAGMSPGLADEINSGNFVKNPTFRMLTNNISEAQDLQVDLRAGSLRAPLDWESDQVFTLEPALAQRFKLNSLITGVLAVIAVSLVVYFRYGNPKVAAPMVVTALSEVVILLGFAAITRLQLDLSHIAGFIAVIGTGVDDLIIIADEVMSEGDVSSSRVFQNRFRKAFWVIGAAAATTIVAMSPLAFLSLGDLRGFAIVTIMGVLIGVLVTRPAYGDILKALLTDR